MKFIDLLRTIFLDYPYVIKIIQWCLVFLSLLALLEYESYEIAPWLWVIYCINSVTYLVIITAALINYLLMKNPERLDLYFSIVGILMYLIGAVGGIYLETSYEPADAENGPSQLWIAFFYIFISLYMIGQIVCSNYFQRTGGAAINNNDINEAEV